MATMQGRSSELGPIGSLISGMYVMWAASYGIDESGREESATGAGPTNSLPPSFSRDRGGLGGGNMQAVEENLAAVKRRRARGKMMGKERLWESDELSFL